MLIEWISSLTLIFGGCCSNALSLEQLTSHHPNSGALITFFQFVLISLYGLSKHLVFSSPRPTSFWQRIPYPRLRPRRIPIGPYLTQVGVFYAISLLNNVAFRYRVPMRVHIIFRSGGIIVNMILGWLVVGKRYTRQQAISVFLVAMGVLLTSQSATRPTISAQPADLTEYLTGISLLSLALLLSGVLGLLQERMFTNYRAPPQGQDAQGRRELPAWQEPLFYLHALALPLFIPIRADILSQLSSINSSTDRYEVPVTVSSTVLSRLPPIPLLTPTTTLTGPGTLGPTLLPSLGLTLKPHAFTLTFSLPKLYPALILNALTQLACVAGVNRLVIAGNGESLTVALVLAVRKAASLLLSAWIFKDSAGPASGVEMWVGAGLVLVGTVGYAIAGGKEKEKTE